jgi:hypothetical protein
MSTYSLSFVVLKKVFGCHSGKKRKRSATRKKHNNCPENARPNGFVAQLLTGISGFFRSGRRISTKNLLSPKIPNIVLTTHSNLVKRILYTVFNSPQLNETQTQAAIFP